MQKKLPGSQLLQSVASHSEAARSDTYKPVQHRPLGSYSVRPSWTPSFPSDNMMQFTNVPTLSLNLLQHFSRWISLVRSHTHDFMVHEPPRISSLIWNQILSPRQTPQQVSSVALDSSLAVPSTTAGSSQELFIPWGPLIPSQPSATHWVTHHYRKSS